MKRILAAVDGTLEATLVIEAAGALAEALDSRVELVHVVAPAAPFAPAPGMVPMTGVDPVPGLVAHARDRLAQLQRDLPAGRVGRSAVEVGPVADTLLRVATETKADLVVLGAHGHGAVARALGTTAARIVNRAHTPVLVVRRPDGGARGVGAPLRIVAAVDSSDTAFAVIARATELARAPGAQVRVLRVEPYLDQARASLPRSDVEVGREVQRLEAGIPDEHRAGSTVVRGDPARTICAFAKEYGADIVVIGAHAYGWTERVVGTTAAWVVDHIDRPLLVVRESTRIPAGIDLRAEHARLDRIYDALLDAFRAGQWIDVQAEWAVFEPALRAHMRLEERVLFPRFRAADASATAALEGQHHALREHIDRFAVAIELHNVVLQDAEELIATLRRHAATEEERFYPWLELVATT